MAAAGDGAGPYAAPGAQCAAEQVAAADPSSDCALLAAWGAASTPAAQLLQHQAAQEQQHIPQQLLPQHTNGSEAAAAEERLSPGAAVAAGRQQALCRDTPQSEAQQLPTLLPCPQELLQQQQLLSQPVEPQQLELSAQQEQQQQPPVEAFDRHEVPADQHPLVRSSSSTSSSRPRLVKPCGLMIPIRQVAHCQLTPTPVGLSALHALTPTVGESCAPPVQLDAPGAPQAAAAAAACRAVGNPPGADGACMEGCLPGASAVVPGPAMSAVQAAASASGAALEASCGPTSTSSQLYPLLWAPSQLQLQQQDQDQSSDGCQGGTQHSSDSAAPQEDLLEQGQAVCEGHLAELQQAVAAFEATSNQLDATLQ